MKVIDRQDLGEKTEQIKKLNEIVEVSFGEGFKANYHPIYSDQYKSFISIFEQVAHKGIRERPDCVGWIAKKTLGGLSSKVAAKFLKGGEDGSKFELQDKSYLNAAKKYAQLYEQEFEKEVIITF